MLAAANTEARLITLPGINHVLKSVPASDRAANVASYSDPSLPLAPGVAKIIADFVLKTAQIRQIKTFGNFLGH